jgi:GNAT superfamily N-acetyltransferase
MIIKRTDSTHPDFNVLAGELESDLKIRDGIDHLYYAELNKIDKLNYLVISYLNGIPIACGGLRPYTTDRMEIKRMYVRPDYRGQGIATAILSELENWSKELGYRYCVLETGRNQPEAIALYKKNNYQVSANFGQYAESPNSICMEKLMDR